jgi:hypothetical protein
MADFISRLVERTLGTAPLVQPLGASTFSPAEPTGDSASLAQVEETSTWPGAPDQIHTSPDTELPLQKELDREEVTAELRHDALSVPRRSSSEDSPSESPLPGDVSPDESHVVESSMDSAQSAIPPSLLGKQTTSEPVTVRDPTVSPHTPPVAPEIVHSPSDYPDESESSERTSDCARSPPKDARAWRRATSLRRA